MKTITAANSIYMLAIAGIYPVHQRLQGYQADAAFATEDREIAQVQMGVDARMSAGYVANAVVQTISLNADSDSIDIFENWATYMDMQKEIVVASGLISLPAIGKKWVMTKGILTRHKPVPDVNRLLTGTTYQITWESAVPSPI